MTNNLKDQYLLEHGVYFLPWIGKNYEQGFKNRRLLVVGEIHYGRWDGKTHTIGNDLTRWCIECVINRVDRDDFWKHLENALLNEKRDADWSPNDDSAIWNKISFYHFIRLIASDGTSLRPDSNLAPASRTPFREVLEQLRPERVLVCGKGLWEWMEPVSHDEDFLHEDVQAYNLDDGSKVWCLAMVHPSSERCSRTHFYPILSAFLDDPHQAAEMLRRR